MSKMRALLAAALLSCACAPAMAQAPVTQVLVASGRAPVSGTFTAAGQRSASFSPLAGRQFYIDLGAFSGAVELDKWSVALNAWVPLKIGATQLAVWSSPAAALMDSWSDDEFGALFSLQCTALTSGTPAYGLHQ